MASISSSSFPPEGGPIRSFLLGEPLDDRWIQIGDGLLVSAVLIRIDQEVAEDIETHETTIFYAHESIKPTKKLFVVLHWMYSLNMAIGDRYELVERSSPQKETSVTAEITS
jgi:hypothetical protein